MNDLITIFSIDILISDIFSIPGPFRIRGNISHSTKFTIFTYEYPDDSKTIIKIFHLSGQMKIFRLFDKNKYQDIHLPLASPPHAKIDKKPSNIS